MPDIFVSYSRRDEEFVRRLVSALEERGKDVWRDKDDIPPAVEWREEIREGIDGSHVFTFILSPDSLASGPCGEELSHAVQTGKSIVPLVRRSPDGTPVPEELARLNYVYAREDDDFGSAVDQLLAAIDGLPAWERTHTRLLLRAGQWNAQGRNRSLLLRGAELREAEQWSAERPERRQPTQLELEYLLASRRGATRRLRGFVAGALLAFAVTAALAVVAVLQRNEATQQRNEAVRQAHLAMSRALAAESTSVADRRLDLAALLALEAYKAAQTAEARAALVTAVEHADRVKAILPGGYKAIASGGQGQRLVTLSQTGAIWLWDLARARRVGTPVHTEQVYTVGFGAQLAADNLALAANGRTVAADDGGITIWNADKGHRVGGPTNSESFEADLTFSPNGAILASGGDNGVTLWSVERRPRGKRLPGSASKDIQGLAFSPKDGVLAAAGSRKIYRWVVRSQRPLAPLVHPPTFVSRVAFSPDGTTLASSASPVDGRGTIRFWHRASRRPFLVLHARGPVRAIGFEDSHTLLAAVGRRVERVDLTRRMPRLGLVSDNPHAIFDLATGRAGTFVTRGADGTVRLWGLGRRVALADQIDPRSVYDLAFSPDGHTIAAVDWKNVRLWNTATRRPAGPPVEGRPVPLKAVAFAGDDVLAIGRENGSVVFVNPNHRLPRARRSSVPLIAGNDVRSVAASTDGKWVASVRGLGSISIWDVPRRRKSGDLALPAASMGSAVAFAPGRPTLAVATRATAGFRGLLGLWDVRTRRRTGRLFGDVPQGVSALAFTPKGRLLASAGGGAIRFWDVASRRSLGALRVGSTISSLTFSRDGQTLAVGAENGVSLWDVRAKSRLGKPLHAGSPTRTVAFSKDGRTLVSGGTGTWLWNAILWSRSLAAFAGRLCPVANRQLTTAEWRQYLPGEPYRKTCAEADFG